jgi:hypothetical protein
MTSRSASPVDVREIPDDVHDGLVPRSPPASREEVEDNDDDEEEEADTSESPDDDEGASPPGCVLRRRKLDAMMVLTDGWLAICVARGGFEDVTTLTEIVEC